MFLSATQGVNYSPTSDEAILARLREPVAAELMLVEERLETLLPETVGEVARTAYRQMLAAGGKRLRPLLTLLSCAASGGEARQAVGLAVAVEVLHLASLIHDDVIDEAQERRGKPSAREQWGNKAAVLVGDLLVAEVFQRLADELELKSLALLARAVSDMCRAELSSSDHVSEPDEATYRRNIQGKTAALMGTVCEAGALTAGNETAAPVLRAYGLHLGEAFQITDDLLDLYGEAEALGKPARQDLRRRQLTLPLIHALRQEAPVEVNRLHDLLSRAPEDLEAGLEAARLAETLGGRLYAEQLATDLVSEAQADLEQLPPSAARECLRELAAYILRRHR